MSRSSTVKVHAARWRWLAWLAALLLLIAVVVLLIGQVRKKEWATDSTTLGLLAGAAVLLFAVIAPWQTARALQRVTTFKFAGLELGLGLAEIKRAERVRPLPGEDDGVGVRERPLTGDPATEFREVVDAMQARLRFSWDILDMGSTGVDKEDYPAIVRSLRDRKQITRDEQKFILDMLTGTDVALGQWSAETRNDFLDSSWEFAIRFGPLVWDRHVRNTLMDDKWFVADYPQTRGHRPDFLAYRDGRWAVMAARVAGSSGNHVSLNSSKNRLRRYPKKDFVDARCIVIPDIREAKEGDEGVKVVKLGHLLSEPEHVFA